MNENIKSMVTAAKNKKLHDFNVSFQAEIKQQLASKFAETKLDIKKKLFSSDEGSDE